MHRASAGLLVSALIVGVGCQSADSVNGGARASSGGSSPNASTSESDGGAAPSTARPRVLVFTKTTGFRHASIPAGIAAVQSLGVESGFDVEATEDATWFTADTLRRFDAVVFLSTSGDILDDAEQQAFEAFIRGGRGFVGVHAAADTEYDWPFYQRLMGAGFLRHPAGTPAGTIHVVDRAHLATAHLASSWPRVDEWYTLRASPAEHPEVHVLLTLDEDSIPLAPEFRMGTHPLAWFQAYGGGRAFTTVLGHTEESFREAAFVQHLRGGILWAATGRNAPATLVHELDGVTAPGTWRPHASPFPFDYVVTKDALTMFDAGGKNQHLSRTGLVVPPRTPYAVEALFTIPSHNRNGLADELNSFSIDFDVQGASGSDTDLEHLYARALNLDLSRATPHTGVVKTMGFVDGVFATTGQRTITGVDFDVEYRMQVAVRGDVVHFALTRGTTTLAAFDAAYAGFPYAPDRTRPVRVGVNTHGTDWTMRDFRVRLLDDEAAQQPRPPLP